MTPPIELYLLSVRMLDLLDNTDIKANGLKKSARAINSFVSKSAELLEDLSSDAHERAVHNFNVVMNSIDKDLLELPIGTLEIEK